MSYSTRSPGRNSNKYFLYRLQDTASGHHIRHICLISYLTNGSPEMIQNKLRIMTSVWVCGAKYIEWVSCPNRFKGPMYVGLRSGYEH